MCMCACAADKTPSPPGGRRGGGDGGGSTRTEALVSDICAHFLGLVLTKKIFGALTKNKNIINQKNTFPLKNKTKQQNQI